MRDEAQRFPVRRRASIAAIFAFALFAAMTVASAQDEDAGAPEPEVRERIVRPPEGSLRRGSFGVPEWAVYAGAGVLVAIAGGALILRLAGRAR